jgi:hypothetical protein
LKILEDRVDKINVTFVYIVQGKKKKPFIDKKSAHNFQLVHRSQRDPLQADEDSSKHVLVALDAEAQVLNNKIKLLCLL